MIHNQQEDIGANKIPSILNNMKTPFILILFILIACQKEPNILPQVEFTNEERFSFQARLRERRSDIKKWALTCPNRRHGETDPYMFEYSEVEDECEQGDSMQRTGISCFAATVVGDDPDTVKARCRDAALSQAPNGRWWRGPVAAENQVEKIDSFSRDMLNGVEGYLIATKDTERAKNFKKWIMEHNMWTCVESSNNRCQLLAGNYSVLYQIWIHMGLKNEMYQEAKLVDSSSPNSAWSNPDPFFENMLNSELYYVTGLKLFEHPPVGFEMNLVAEQILYRRYLNQFDANASVAKIQKAALSDKIKEFAAKQPDNPFFRFLAEGATKEIIEKTLSLCPKDKIIRIPDWKNQKVSDWSWQRDTAEKTWEKAVGHDCIFLINVLLAYMDGKLSW